MVKDLINDFDKNEKNFQKKSSVLVFLPGLQEINQANEALMKQEKKNQGLYQVNYLIHRVHSTLETHKNNKCLRDLIRDPAERIRKVNKVCQVEGYNIIVDCSVDEYMRIINHNSRY